MVLIIFRGPLRHVQAPDALLQIGEQLQFLGIKKPLILVSPSAKRVAGQRLTQGRFCDHKKIPYALKLVDVYERAFRASQHEEARVSVNPGQGLAQQRARLKFNTQGREVTS
jgi:hypothetical protein